MKQFLIIDNKFFKPEERYFEKIGTEGFCIYCFIKYKCANNEFCDISLSQIHHNISSDYGLKEISTIKKYIETLTRNDLVFIEDDYINHNKNYFFNVKLNKSLFDEDNTEYKGYTSISVDLFIDKVKDIGNVGWALLCLLTNLHNKNYGSETSEGFANPSEEYISNVLSVHTNTIKKYSEILEKKKLIKKYIQPPQIIKDKHGGEKNIYIPNHYVVKNRLSDNKYYLDFDKNKDKDGNELPF